MSWVIIEPEPGVYTTGFYAPDGMWHPDRDYATREKAAARVSYLNGGRIPPA